jgi:hypothetical protein
VVLCVSLMHTILVRRVGRAAGGEVDMAYKASSQTQSVQRLRSEVVVVDGKPVIISAFRK